MANTTHHTNGIVHTETDIEERITLTKIISHDTEDNIPSPAFPKGRQYRKYLHLAIASILCGCSCIGIPALIYAVRAEEKWNHDPEEARRYAKRSRKCSIISILAFYLILALLLALVGLVSYLVTLAE